MTRSQRYRISAFGLFLGSVVFVIHIVLRSLITAGVDPPTRCLWISINTLGVIGAVLVFLGLPAIYSYLARPVGLLLISVAWMFFGLFLSFYSVVLPPKVAQPSIGLVVTFVAGLVAWLVGSVLLAVPFIRGTAKPRWVGYTLVSSSIWMLVGDLVIAPDGPAPNVAINLISNLRSVLLVVALGSLGLRMWSNTSG